MIAENRLPLPKVLREFREYIQGSRHAMLPLQKEGQIFLYCPNNPIHGEAARPSKVRPQEDPCLE